MSLSCKAHALKVDRSQYGVTRNGSPVFQYALENRHGMTVKVLDYGGTITEIDIPDRRGDTINVVLQLPNLQAYKSRPNFSSLIGRFANRIGQGGITLRGHFYPLNAGVNGIISHGGQDGFSTKMWHAETYADSNECGVRMSYVSPDGENGFPGEVKVIATFSLDEKNQLKIRYEATTSRNTVVNFTHHMFLNLDGFGDVGNQYVRINASHYLPIDERKLVTGDIESVRGTPFDLRRSTIIAQGLAAHHQQIMIAKGYDHNFVLDKSSDGEMSLAAEARSGQTGIELKIYTTEPGIQFYTGNTFDGRLLDSKQRPVLSHYAMALETQHYPDSPHHENFPSTVLNPGQAFKSETIYEFLTDK